jgi:predicted nucleic acid-binding protein
MKIYVDTNIFIDFVKEDESKRRFIYTYDFFRKGWKCKFELIISDWTRSELSRHVKEEDLNLLLNEFKSKNKLHFITHTKEETTKAKNKNEHWQDELHLMLAIKSKADMIVTRDKDFISYASQTFDIRVPENIFYQQNE